MESKPKNIDKSGTSSTVPTPTLPDTPEAAAKFNELLLYFSKRAKIDTTEEIIPTKQVRDVDAESVAPKLQTGTVQTAARHAAEKQDLSALEPKTGGPLSAAALDMISPYAGVSILYLNRRTPSTYIPSANMMYYIIHHMNDILSDSRAFRRICPDYHPYIFRLYCGVLFWVQCLRVTVHANTAQGSWHEFLSRFLETHPLESLPVPSPLVTLFKTLCASQPEMREYGPVCPILPAEAGPQRRDAFIRADKDANVLPNVPGIFALLTDLNDKINAEAPIFPAKSKHIPVGNNAVTFGFHQFPAHAERSQRDKWSLVSTGLDYDCEADKKMHEVFAERYASFNFPTMAAADDLRNIDSFLGMSGRTDWFGQVKDVAAAVASVFTDSGTLYDCPVSGVNANQYVVEYLPTSATLPAPHRIADPASSFPFSLRVRTSVRNFSQLSLSQACAAQTNTVMPFNHPFLVNFGEYGETRTGDFWQIEPSESSDAQRENYIGVRTVVRKLYSTKH
nr:coat protein [Dichroa partitivirus 1]